MKLKHLLIAALAIFGTLAATSCKKDDGFIKKSQLDGIWVCTYILENNGPLNYYPYVLLDVDAAAGKATLFQRYDNDITGTFELRNGRVYFSSGSTSTEYEISSFDKTSVVFTYSMNGNKYDACFVNIHRILPGIWWIKWYDTGSENSSRYIRIDNGGKGVQVDYDGNEIRPLEWWIEPVSSFAFKLVLSAPSIDYENTFTIHSVISDDRMEGYDAANYSITIARHIY